MAFWGFASLVLERVVQVQKIQLLFTLLIKKNCDRDVKAHLKPCNILMNVKSVNSEMRPLCISQFKARPHEP